MQHHDDEEEYYATTISTLQGIATTKCGIYDDSVAHRIYIEDEIKDTAEYLDWIANRYVTIDNMV